MRWFVAVCAWALAFNVQARSNLVLNVTLDYDQERDHVATQTVFNDLAKYLSGAVGQPVKLIMTQNAERVGERVRTGTYSMMLAPAQLVGTAMRHGYTPIARTEQDARVLLLATKASQVRNLEAARGKRIALPHRESLVSFMVNGEMNARGLSPAKFFGQLMYMNQYAAVLYAMDIGQADLVAVKEAAAKDWLAQHKDVVVAHTFPDVPVAGVVVNDKLDGALKDKLRSAFTKLGKDLETRLARVKLGAFEPADKTDFEFVSTRGFYSPEVMPGATIPTAELVKKLMDQGVPLFDVRSQAQYREAHIPGAVNLPYQMNSPKEVEYDDSVDAFDLSRLPKDKNAPMIFQCNGAECWYSYKAARYMVKRGYAKIYWFRTGLPAWKASGYPVRQGA
ncbi:MAG: PhnD/SsuA/transferrin family substrate-binding protein [Pseudomonadota bacterium]|nr:PhnD/SsuA/transferrin family substrate-binding protein [Pseudomonadota bacterium]